MTDEPLGSVEKFERLLLQGSSLKWPVGVGCFADIRMLTHGPPKAATVSRVSAAETGPYESFLSRHLTDRFRRPRTF